jgi:hypothetical protein
VLKKLSLILVALLVLTACGSSDAGDTTESTDTTTTTETESTETESSIETAVEVSYEVSGNSVSVYIKDANGESCVESENPDCAGFFISWEANFDDLTKNISYEDPIVINDLVAGDEIEFQLRYQEVAGSADSELVKRYPFSFNG